METRHNKKISTIQIRPYQETDFERLAQIHDCARKNELALADLSAAFIPLSPGILPDNVSVILNPIDE